MITTRITYKGEYLFEADDKQEEGVADSDVQADIKKDEKVEKQTKEDGSTKTTKTTTLSGDIFVSKNMASAFENNSAKLDVGALIKTLKETADKAIGYAEKNSLKTEDSAVCFIQCTCSTLANTGEAEKMTFAKLALARIKAVEEAIKDSKDLPKISTYKYSVDDAGVLSKENSFKVPVLGKYFLPNADSSMGPRTPYQDFYQSKSTDGTVTDKKQINYKTGKANGQAGSGEINGRPASNYDAKSSEASPITVTYVEIDDKFDKTKIPKDAVTSVEQAKTLAAKVDAMRYPETLDIQVWCDTKNKKNIVAKVYESCSNGFAKYYQPFITLYVKFGFVASGEKQEVKDVAVSLSEAKCSTESGAIGISQEDKCVVDCDVEIISGRGAKKVRKPFKRGKRMQDLEDSVNTYLSKALPQGKFVIKYSIKNPNNWTSEGVEKDYKVDVRGFYDGLIKSITDCWDEKVYLNWAPAGQNVPINKNVLAESGKPVNNQLAEKFAAEVIATMSPKGQLKGILKRTDLKTIGKDDFAWFTQLLFYMQDNGHGELIIGTWESNPFQKLPIK